ncbi:MAG: MBL fold metallo-hydrolase, partial [Ginsengibacter sp.]
REVEKRMSRLGLSMQKVKAIFVSHEHSDHIKGIAVLSKKYQLMVFITPAVLKISNIGIAPHLASSFKAFEKICVGGLCITTFPKYHDACDPYSFMISYKGINVGVFTDIGKICQNLTDHFRQCHAAFLEANYDEDMLQNGNYPFHLKRRISGGNGHLSNKEALSLFNNHRSKFLTHILLSHLSKNNNTPQLVQELFDTHAKGVEIIVASRYSETAVFEIGRGKQIPIAIRQNYVQTQLCFE